LGFDALRHCQHEALERRELLSTTTTQLTSSQTAPYIGQAVTLTATVSSSGGTPTGNVQFYEVNPSDGPDILLATQALAGGQASCTLTFNAYEIVYAVYPGNSQFSRSSSSSLAEAVTKVPTSVSLSANVANSLNGQPLTLTAAVSAVNGSTPTGNVSFYQINPGDGPSILLGTTALDSHGQANCTTSTLTLGSDNLFCVYGGSSTMKSCGSSNLRVAVLSVFKPAVISSTPTALPGQTLTFTAAMPNSLPTGTVKFYQVATGGDILLDTQTLSGGQATSKAIVFSSVGSYQIYASYLGDATYPSQTSSQVTQSVAKAASAVTLATSGSPAYATNPVTLTATVTTACFAAGTPSGTVSFYQHIGGDSADVLLGSATLNSGGQAVLSVSTIPLGSDHIYAAYVGSAVLLGSSSSLVTQQIAAPPKAIVTSSDNPSVPGENVTYTATMPITANVTPTGSVSFYLNYGAANQSLLATVALSGGTALLALASSTIGNETITCVYTGDSTFPSTTSALTETVAKAASSTTIATSGSPAYAGNPVTLTATVTTAAAAAGTPSGNVSFYRHIGGDSADVLLGTSILNPNGQATLAVSNLPLAYSLIYAVYAGNGALTASTSAMVSQQITAPPVAVVTSSVANATVGQPVTFTAAFANSTAPTGTVQFWQVGTGGAADTLLDTETLAAGTATSTGVTFNVAGSVGIYVIYSGDGTYPAVRSATFNLTVQKAIASVVLSASAPSTYYQDTVTFTAQVHGPGNLPTASGSVSFYWQVGGGSSDVLLGTVSLLPAGNNSAAASLDVWWLRLGVSQIYALYNGNGWLAQSGSNLVAEQVLAKLTTTTTLAAPTPNPALPGQAVALTATVAAASGASGAPSGSVAFYMVNPSDGAPDILLGSAGLAADPTVAGQAEASITTVSLPSLNDPVYVSYSGDSTFAVSVSYQQTVVVAKAATTTTLTSSASTVIVGQPVTFSATVGTANVSAGTPTGVVQFWDFDGVNGWRMFDVETLDANGQASCTTTSLGPNNNAVKAVYLGSNLHVGSSTLIIESVVGIPPTLTASANPAPPGVPITFTAAFASTAPTGTIQFWEVGSSTHDVVLDSETLVAGQATSVPLAFSFIGNIQVYAVYGGDNVFPYVQTAPITFTVAPAAATVALVSSASPAFAGDSVTLTATVSSPSVGQPSGTVNFYQTPGSGPDILLGSAQLAGNGGAQSSTAALNLATLPTGDDSIYATYSGSTAFLAGSSAVITEQIVVSPAPAVTSSSNPGLAGEPITFTATLATPRSGPAAGVAPTGSVRFFALPASGPSVSLGLVQLTPGVASSVAQVTTSLDPQTYTITAQYSGDGNFPRSSSGMTETVIQVPTSLSLAASSTSALQGAPVTFTAVVSANSPATRTPLGAVTFYDQPAGGAVVALGPPHVVDGTGSATLTLDSLAPGSNPVYAVFHDNFAGDSADSTSATVPVTVLQPTATALATSANPAGYGSAVTLTANVTQQSASSNAAAPTGSVAFFDGLTNVGTANLVQGVAALSVVLGPGAHSLRAVYSGDGANAPSTSSTLAQSVNSLVTITADIPNAAESGPNGPVPGDFSVTRVGPVNAAMTVDFMLAGSAVNGSDYAPLSGTVIIPSGAATVQIPVSPLDDGLVNPVRQSIVVSAGPTGTYTLSVGNATTAPLSAMATASDLQSALAALAGIGTGNCLVSGAGSASEPFIVAFTGALFEGVPPTITADSSQLAGGAVAVTTLAPISANLQATLQVQPVKGVYDVAAPQNSATVTIADPEPHLRVLQGSVPLANGTSTVDFGATTFSTDVTKTLTLASDGNAPLTIDPTSLVLPAGFQLVGGLPTQIAAGANATLTIALDATSAIGSFAGAVSFATNDSTDDPFAFNVTGQVLPQVTITATTANAAENGSAGPQAGDVTITRTGPTDAPLTIAYTLAGNAVNATDFQSLNGSLVIPAGSASADIPLVPLDDGLVNAVRQEIVIPPGAAGTFRLTVGGQTTPYLLATATAGDLQTALNALTTIGAGDCQVSGEGTLEEPFVIGFTGALFDGTPPTITADSSMLTCGTVAVTTMPALPPNLSATFTLQSSAGVYSVSGSPTATVTIADPEPHLAVALGSTTLVNGAGTINFGSMFSGQTQTESITITSDGNVPLMISSLSLPQGYQLVGNLPGPIVPGASVTLSITLDSAGSLGSFGGVVSLATNDTFDADPFEFNVTGQVLPWTPQDVTIADFGLVNDTGVSSTDHVTSDDRLQGVVNGLFTGQFAGGWVVVDFQSSTDGGNTYQDDGATAQIAAAGTNFLFDPRAANSALVGYLGQLDVRYQIIAYDQQHDSVPGGWSYFSMNLVPVEIGAYIADFGLANDTAVQTGAAGSPPTTYDPRVTGAVKGTFLGASVDVQFYDSTTPGQGAGPNTVPIGSVTDITTSPTSFIFDPTVAGPSLAGYAGPLEIDYRTVERDAQGNVIATSAWTPFTMNLFVATPTVAVSGFQLVDDTDPTSLSLATADPRVTGTVTGDFTHGGAIVEFSHHGDGIVDGSVAVTQANPTFTYDPRVTEPALSSFLGTLDLENRTIQSDGNGGTIRGAWTSFPFTLEQAASPATIQSFALSDVTGSAGPPPVTSDPTVKGKVVGASTPAVTIVFEYNSDTAPDGSATSLPDGSFQFTLPNLPYGVVTVTARAVESNSQGGFNLYGAPTSLTFDFEPPPSPTISSLTLADDTGAPANPGQTTNPAVTGQITGTTLGVPVDIEFDTNGHGIADAEIPASGNAFTFTPTGLVPGPVTIQARTVVHEPNATGLTYGAWTPLSFTYLATPGSTLSIANLQLASLANGPAGSFLPANPTAADPTVIGQVEDASGGVDFQTVQFDYNGDGQPDASTTTDAQGNFTFAPSGLAAGNQTIGVRAKIWDMASQGFLYSSWTTISFNYQPTTTQAVAVSQLSLLDDVGTATTGPQATDPTVVGQLAGGTSVAYLTVQFDTTGSGMPDASVLADANGAFQFTPTGLPFGTVTIAARARMHDTSTGGFTYGAWTTVTFDYLQNAFAAPTIDAFSLASVTDAPTSAGTPVSANPTLKGHVTYEGDPTQLVIELDTTGNGQADASVIPDSNGNFIDTPKYLSYGTVTLAARISSYYDPARQAIVAGLWVPLTFDYEQQARSAPVMISLGLEDTSGNVTINTTSTDAQPVIGGRVSYQGDLAGITIQFDTTGGTTPNATATTDDYGHFDFPPAGLTAGNVTINVRTRVFDDVGNQVLYGAWTPLTFNYQPPAAAPLAIDSLSLASGSTDSQGNLTATDPTVTGVVSGDGDPNDVVIEFDTTLSGQPDATTTTDAGGNFTFTPAGLAPGAVTIAARVRDTAADGTSVYSPWTLLGFTLQSASSGTIVSQLVLADDNSTAADQSTSDATITGLATVAGSGNPPLPAAGRIGAVRPHRFRPARRQHHDR
jgi:hypothetical protein